MGVIKRGILGGFSGKVANVVGSSWKGISVMRSLPLSVANPKTNAQIQVRNKFSTVARYGSQLLSTIIKPLWDRFAQEMSGYNAFVKVNYERYDEENEFGADGNLVISQGKLGETQANYAALGSGGAYITLRWDSTPQGSYQQGTDELYAVVFDGNPQLAFAGKTTATRQSGSIELQIPQEYQGDSGYHVYIAFAREDGTIVGDTSYKFVTQG